LLYLEKLFEYERWAIWISNKELEFGVCLAKQPILLSNVIHRTNDLCITRNLNLTLLATNPGVQIARRGEHRHVNRTDSSSSSDETATASGNVAAILPHPTTNSSVLEVVIQAPDTSNPTDEMATSSTSSALTTALNTMAFEMAPFASSSSNQTDTMADDLATLGNAIITGFCS
jgi:hypothetical protein